MGKKKKKKKDIPLTKDKYGGKRIGTITKVYEDAQGNLCTDGTIDMRKLSEEETNAIFGRVK